jgi:hypothetical protein
MKKVPIEEYDGQQGIDEECFHAVNSQDACNLSGIVFAFADAMKKICEESHRLGKGTDWKNGHPIARMYAEQIMFLTSGTEWRDASRFCCKLGCRIDHDKFVSPSCHCLKEQE